MRTVYAVASFFVLLLLVVTFAECVLITTTRGTIDAIAESVHLWLLGLGVTQDNALALMPFLLFYSALAPLLTYRS